MDIEQLKDEWGRGKNWIESFTRDNPELENLADGVPITQQKNAPQVGSVTLLNAVRQIPRNSVQDMPILSAQINGTKLSVDALIGSFLLRSVIFSEDVFGMSVLSTMQMAAQTALTTGFAALRASVGRQYNQFTTMLEAIHYNDLVIEPGVFDSANSQYFDVRTRVTKGALRDLISKAEGNKNTLWNVEGLKELYELGPQQFDYSRYLSVPRQNAALDLEGQYDFITHYGTGPYYTTTVWSHQIDKPLMEFKSKSKFGFPRVTLLVIDPAQLSPFGISRARLASPMANYGNIYLQSTAKMQLLNADAPVFKRGLFTTATPLRRGAQWESQDPNADVKIMELSNSTLEQFNNVMQYIDNNILATMGVGGTSTAVPSSAYKNVDAVKAENQVKDLSSQQVTAIIESALRQYALTSLDLLISEQVGKTALTVDDECKNAINQLNDPNVHVGDDNKVMVDWKKYYDRIDTMTVTVDLSIRRDQLADKKRGDMQDIFTVMKQTAGQDPVANATANALGQELVQDTVPEVSKQMDNIQSMQPVGGEPTPMGQ